MNDSLRPPASETPLPRLAVLGAGGFVGTRLVSLARAGNGVEVIPVLRNYKGLARLRGAIDEAVVADTSTLAGLTEAIRGCDAVVNLTNGDLLDIVADTQLVHAACAQAGVQRLIHTSSAVVFGRVIDPANNDDSPPDTNSWMLYARGKAQAEVWLRGQLGQSSMSIAVLRPGIIWGPGSHWSKMVGDQLQRDAAVLPNGGRGIANLIYVDNLCRAILRLAERTDGPSGFYNISDREPVTWLDYYTGLASRLGYGTSAVHTWPDAKLSFTVKHAFEWATQQAPLYRLMKWTLKRASGRTKKFFKARLQGSPEPPISPGTHVVTAPKPSREHWTLFNTVHPQPPTKLFRDFGDLDFISFAAALDRTASWLRFVGYGESATVPTESSTTSATFQNA
jgi:nucleoside-diphosphate-sugar epimerase